jgi:hypothetical protein
MQIVLVLQTLAVVFLLWRLARADSELRLLAETVGAIERELEVLHRQILRFEADKAPDHKMR